VAIIAEKCGISYNHVLKRISEMRVIVYSDGSIPMRNIQKSRKSFGKTQNRTVMIKQVIVRLGRVYE